MENKDVNKQQTYHKINFLDNWILWFFDFIYYFIVLFLLYQVNKYIVNHNLIVYTHDIYYFLWFIIFILFWYLLKNKTLKLLFSLLTFIAFFIFFYIHLKLNYIYIWIVFFFIIDILIKIYQNKKNEIKIKSQQIQDDWTFSNDNLQNWNLNEIIEKIKDNWWFEEEKSNSNWIITYNNNIFVKNTTDIIDKIDDLIWDYVKN